jgi:DNA-binding beta-propeller fold protein YncE
MTINSLGIAVGVVFLLTGCNGQSGGQATIPQGGMPADHAAHGSWMKPGAKGDDLLYVSQYASSGIVNVFSYPGLTFEGELTGLNKPHGLCADKAGHVFVADFGAENIVEYARNGIERIRTLNDAGWNPNGCSVDPTTGNLAVANYQGASSSPGNLVVYKDASGSPKVYSISRFVRYYNCGYDDNGNLFVDGLGRGRTLLAELPKGSTVLNVVKFRHLAFPGSVQWDGKYMTVVSAGDFRNIIYRFTISGRKGTTVGSTPLNAPYLQSVPQSWIQGKTVVAITQNQSNQEGIGFWHYPAGGSPYKIFGSLGNAYGLVVISLK